MKTQSLLLLPALLVLQSCMGHYHEAPSSEPLSTKPIVVPTASAPQYNASAPITGIGNFHEVHPFLLRGAAPTVEGLRSLKNAGVRTVIDFRIAPKTVAKEKKAAESLGLKWVNIPMSGDPPTAREVQKFLTTTTDPASQPVFVHCEHGADRTGCMVGIYRERVDHWSFPQTYAEMRRYGFHPIWYKLKATVQKNAPANAPARA